MTEQHRPEQLAAGHVRDARRYRLEALAWMRRGQCERAGQPVQDAAIEVGKAMGALGPDWPKYDVDLQIKMSREITKVQGLMKTFERRCCCRLQRAKCPRRGR